MLKKSGMMPRAILMLIIYKTINYHYEGIFKEAGYLFGRKLPNPPKIICSE